MRTMSGLSTLYKANNQFDQATSLVRQTYEMQKEILGDTHPQTLSSLFNLGQSLMSTYKYEEAEDILRRVASARAQALGEDHPLVFWSLSRLAECLEYQGKDFEETELMLCRLVDRAINAHGLESVESLRQLFVLSKVQEHLYSRSYSERFLFELVEIYKTDFNGNEFVRVLIEKTAIYKCEDGKSEEGISILELILSWRRANNGWYSTATLDAEMNLAELQMTINTESGLAAFCNALAHSDSAGDYHRWAHRKKFASVLRSKKRFREAELLLDECLAGASQSDIAALRIEMDMAHLHEEMIKEGHPAVTSFK